MNPGAMEALVVAYNDKMLRLRRVAELRTQGWYDAHDIATKLGCTLPQVRAALRQLDKQYLLLANKNVELERGHSAAIIDRMLRTLIPLSERDGDPNRHYYAQRVIQLLERKAKLLGLDRDTGRGSQVGVTVNQNNVSITQNVIEDKLREYTDIYDQLAGAQQPRDVIDTEAKLLPGAPAGDGPRESMDPGEDKVGVIAQTSEVPAP